jgi:glycosyltransferase involved in cell wall biosynthesis
MKIAVYSIAKNEAQFVQRWAESAKEADLILLADTGSTDDTVMIAKRLGVKVKKIKVDPWRFDAARNMSLDFIPTDYDYCIALDLDEVLLPGWRQAIENTKPETTRIRYQYTWSWEADGKPGLVYGGDKIHRRNGYFWRHPVHEVLASEYPEVQEWADLQIHHYPDNTKPRSQYFPLLKLAIEEDPDDDRNAFYYARELFFHGHNEEAIIQFKRHLSLPRAVWKPERAASMRYLAKLDTAYTESWLLQACAETPERREPWVELAEYYYSVQQWPLCLAAAERAIAIVEKPLEYLCEPKSWGATPHDIASIAAWYVGTLNRAAEHAKKALEFEPDNERIRGNYEMMRVA